MLIGLCRVLRTLDAANCACMHLQSPEEPVPKRGIGAQRLSSAILCQGKPLGILLRFGVNSFDLDDSP